jgi:hypothetical protein
VNFVENAENLHVLRLQPDFFMRLARRRGEQRAIDPRIVLSSGERNLAAVVRQGVGTLREQHVDVTIGNEQWHEYSCPHSCRDIDALVCPASEEFSKAGSKLSMHARVRRAATQTSGS